MADAKNWWQPLDDFAAMISRPIFPNPANAFAPERETEPLFTTDRRSAAEQAGFGPVEQAQRAVAELGDFMSRPLFENPANAFRPDPNVAPIPSLPARPARAPDVLEQAIGLASPPTAEARDSAWDWWSNTPAMSYAQARARSINAQQPDQQSSFWGDLGAMTQTALTYINVPDDEVSGTPLPGINLNLAEIFGPALVFNAEQSTYFSGLLGIPQPGIPDAGSTQRLHDLGEQTRVDWTGRNQKYRDPDYWGMDPGQAQEFAMAALAAKGFNEPDFTNQLLPREGRDNLTAAEAYAYQARWITNRDRDIAGIMRDAETLAALATSPTDPNANPRTQALLNKLGVPTPAEVTRQWEQYNAQTKKSGKFDAELGYLEFGLQKQGLLEGGPASSMLMASLNDPQAYANLYGTSKFYELLGAAREADVQLRGMPLEDVQDRGIPIANQLAYGMLLGIDGIWNAGAEALGLTGKALRFANAMGIVSEVGDTAVDATTRAARAARNMNTAAPWRFTDELMQSAATMGNNIKRYGGGIFGAGMGLFGGYSMLTGASQEEDAGQRNLLLGMGAAFLGMGAVGAKGLTGEIVDMTGIGTAAARWSERTSSWVSAQGRPLPKGEIWQELTGATIDEQTEVTPSTWGRASESFFDRMSNFLRPATRSAEEEAARYDSDMAQYYGPQNAHLQIPDSQRLTMPDPISDERMAVIDSGDGIEANLLRNLHRDMRQTYERNILGRYPDVQSSIDEVLQRGKLTGGQRAAYELTSALLEDLQPGAISNSELFRLMPGNGAPEEYVGHTMAEINQAIGYNTELAADWTYGFTLQIRPDVDRRAAPRNYSNPFEGVDRSEMLNTLAALGEATGIQVQPWVEKSRFDPSNRGRISNYGTEVQLTYSRAGAESIGYLDEQFLSNSYNRDALLRQEMVLDIQQRDYDIFGNAGRLRDAGTSKRAEAMHDASIRRAVYQSFSGDTEELQGMLTAASNNPAEFQRIQEAINDYHLTLGRRAAGTTGSVLSFGPNNTPWNRLNEEIRTPIVNELTQRAGSMPGDNGNAFETADMLASNAVLDALTGNTMPLDQLLYGAGKGIDPDLRAGAAIEARSLMANYGITARQETLQADQYFLQRPPLPGEARAQSRLSRNGIAIDPGSPLTFDPSAALAPLRSVTDSLRSELSAERARNAVDFAGMKLLYEIIGADQPVMNARGGLEFNYTGEIDSRTLLSADQYLERQQAPYHVAWDQLGTGNEGQRITLASGRPEQPAVTRSAAYRLDERVQGAWERQQAARGNTSIADANLLEYGVSLLDALDDGRGVFRGNQNAQYNAYGALGDLASEYGYGLNINAVNDAGFNYRLTPLEADDTPINRTTMDNFFRRTSNWGMRTIRNALDNFLNPNSYQYDPSDPSLVYDDGSPFVRQQTELAAPGSAGSRFDEPGYTSPPLSAAARRQFAPAQDIIEQRDPNSVYMALAPGSYAIDENGNLLIMPGPQAQGMQPGAWNPRTRSYDMRPSKNAYGWMAYSDPGAAAAANYSDVLGTPYGAESTSITGRNTRGDQSLLKPEDRNYGPGLIRTETQVFGGGDVARWRDYGQDPATRVTPESIASEARDWESGSIGDDTYNGRGTRDTAEWALTQERAEERAIVEGWTYAAPVATAAMSRAQPVVPYAYTGIDNPTENLSGWYGRRMAMGLDPEYASARPETAAALQERINQYPVVRIDRDELANRRGSLYSVQDSRTGGITTVNWAQWGPVDYNNIEYNADQPLVFKPGSYSLGVVGDYDAPGPDTLTLNRRERPVRYGAGSATFLPGLGETTVDMGSSVRVDVPGGRRNLPKNWRIMGQDATSTRIQPDINFTAMPVDDPITLAVRQATTSEARLERDLYENQGLTGAEGVENRMPWYMQAMDERIGRSVRDLIGGRSLWEAWWEQTNRTIRYRPAAGSANPVTDVGMQDFEPNRSIYNERVRLFAEDEAQLTAEESIAGIPAQQRSRLSDLGYDYTEIAGMTERERALALAGRNVTERGNPWQQVWSSFMGAEENARQGTNAAAAATARRMGNQARDSEMAGNAARLRSLGYQDRDIYNMPEQRRLEIAASGTRRGSVDDMNIDYGDESGYGDDLGQWHDPSTLDVAGRLMTSAPGLAMGFMGQQDEDGDGEPDFNWGMALGGAAIGAIVMGGNFRQLRTAAGQLINMPARDMMRAENVAMGKAITAIEGGVVEDIAIVGQEAGRTVSRVTYATPSGHAENFIFDADPALVPGYNIPVGATIGEQAFQYSGVAGSRNRPPAAWTGGGFRYGAPGSAEAQARIAELPAFQRAQEKLAALGGDEAGLTPNERLLLQQQRGVQVGEPFSLWDTATIINTEQVGSDLTRIVYGYGFDANEQRSSTAILRGFQEITVGSSDATAQLTPGGRVAKGTILGEVAGLPTNLSETFAELPASDLGPYQSARLSDLEAKIESTTTHIDTLVEDQLRAEANGNQNRANNIAREIQSANSTLRRYRASRDALAGSMAQERVTTAAAMAVAPATGIAQRDRFTLSMLGYADDEIDSMTPDERQQAMAPVPAATAAAQAGGGGALPPRQPPPPPPGPPEPEYDGPFGSQADEDAYYAAQLAQNPSLGMGDDEEGVGGQAIPRNMVNVYGRRDPDQRPMYGPWPADQQAPDPPLGWFDENGQAIPPGAPGSGAATGQQTANVPLWQQMMNLRRQNQPTVNQAVAAVPPTGRPGRGAWNPFAPTQEARAVKVRNVWDLIGTSITSMTDSPENLTTFMRTLGEDPDALLRGIPAAMLPGMEDQADANGLIRLGAGELGNRELASTMPVIRAGRDVFISMADKMERDAAEAMRVGEPNPITPAAFKENYWNRSILATGAAYYGADQKNILTRVLDENAYWWRKLAAETKLNINPGAWFGNLFSGHWTAAAEGAQSTTPTGDYRSRFLETYNLEGPTARMQGGLEGEVIGAGAYLGNTGGSIFRATTWTERLLGPGHYDASGALRFGEGILSGISDSTKARLTGWAEDFDASAPFFMKAMAEASERGSKLWTGQTHVPGSGERVGFGESAMYYRFSAEGLSQFLGTSTKEWFDPLFTRMGADANLDPAIVSRIQGYMNENAGNVAPANLATGIYRIIDDAGADRRLYQDWIGREVLPANLDLHNAALKAATATGKNIMLDPSTQTNLDHALGWVAEFSYFTTHAALNWGLRSLRNPTTITMASQFNRAAYMNVAQQEAEGKEVPARLQRNLPAFGMNLGNLAMSMSGIGKLFPNEYAQSEWDEADTWGEKLLAGSHALGFNFLPPITAALSGGDVGALGAQMVPQANTINDMNMATGGVSTDPYDHAKAARWLGSAAAVGRIDPIVGDLAQQALYDIQWGTHPGQKYPQEIQDAVTAAYKATGSEQLFTDLARFATGLSLKPAMNEDEARAGFLANSINTISGINEDAGKTARAALPNMPPYYAANSIYPEQEGDTPPPYRPLDRLPNDWMPEIPSKPPPTGWTLPAFDTTSGTRISSDPAKNRSKYDMSYADTALYMLFDPRTGDPFYVGQSVDPSGRMVQHLNEANKSDRFAHPKIQQFTELLAAGAVPEMYVFDRRPGDDQVQGDEADIIEQVWIGYLVHEKGQTANISDIMPRAQWERQLAKLGMTIEQMDQDYESFRTRVDPRQERVQLERAPKITESQFVADSVPPSVLGNKAADYIPDETAWGWYRNNAQERTISRERGIDWADSQWGLEDVGVTKRGQLWEYGITTWEQMAQPTPQQQAQMLVVADNNASTVAAWQEKAEQTLLANTRPLPQYAGSAAAAPTDYPPTQSGTDPRGFSFSRPAEGTERAPAVSRTQAAIANAQAQVAQPLVGSFTDARGAGGGGGGGGGWGGAGDEESLGPIELMSQWITLAAADPGQAMARASAVLGQSFTRSSTTLGSSLATSSAVVTGSYTPPPTATGAVAAAPPDPLYLGTRLGETFGGPRYNTYFGMGLGATLGDNTTAQAATGLMNMLGVAAGTAASWLLPQLASAGAYAGNMLNQARTPQPSTVQAAPRQGLPAQAPGAAQTGQYWYFPGYRPNAEPGQQFWSPELPNGQQFWVDARMIASGEAYRDADYVNNPQFDPGNPQTSLARMTEFYGPLQPVPLQSLRTQGAYMGKGPFTTFDQQRTVRTGPGALGSNPYGVSGSGGMLETQGAPDPQTQPELYQRWVEEVYRPRGEYGIWLESPVGGAPAVGYQESGRGLTWDTKERTQVTSSAPGQVIYAGPGEQGQMVIVQHDFGQTIYNNLSGAAVQQGQQLATGDLVGLSSKNFSFGFQLAGDETGYTDPTPYLPSTGERGASGWALTDIPGVSAREASMFVDMGFRTPEALLAGATPASIDQHPVFGGAFDAQAGWNVIGATNALLQSGQNPNPPVTTAQARVAPSRRGAIGSGAARSGAAAPAASVAEFAAASNVNPALLQAVLNVEAGGRTNDADTGLAIARFEAHVFRDNSGIDGATFDQNFRVHSWASADYKDPATGEWRNIHENQASEQAAIALATSLTSRDKALAASSQGGAQIMGFHAEKLGYKGAGAMYDDFSANPDAQLQGFFTFLNKTGLINKLRDNDIEGFVTGYNGTANVAGYSALLRQQVAAIESAPPGSGAAAPAASAEPESNGLNVLQPGILPGLTPLRLGKLAKQTDYRTVDDLGELDPEADAKWLADTIGASDEDAAAMITAAQEWTQPGLTTRPATVAYLFATGNKNEITGDNLSKENLEAIARVGAGNMKTLAAANPRDLVARVADRGGKLTYAQANNAVQTAKETLAAQGIDVETGTRVVTPYNEIPAPGQIDSPDDAYDQVLLSKDLFPGLTAHRIELLNAAGISTVGQLRQLGAKGSGIRNERVPANTNRGITTTTATELGRQARHWAPEPDNYKEETRLEKGLFTGLTEARLNLLNAAGITTVGQLRQLEAAELVTKTGDKLDKDAAATLREGARNWLPELDPEEEASTTAAPLAATLADPSAQRYAAQAGFLGKDPRELENLDPGAVDKMVNDKLSTYEQPQMGYGVEDQRMAQFRQQQFQIGESMTRTAQRAQNAIDRRQVRGQAPAARTPDVGSLVRSTVAGMEDKLTAKIFKQLQRSLV